MSQTRKLLTSIAKIASVTEARAGSVGGKTMPAPAYDTEEKAWFDRRYVKPNKKFKIFVKWPTGEEVVINELALNEIHAERMALVVLFNDHSPGGKVVKVTELDRGEWF